MAKPKPKKRRRDLAPEAPPEIELDELTGARVGSIDGREGAARLWVRKNKPDPEQRFQFYGAVPVAKRIHAYVRSTNLTYGKFFELAALAYLDSKGR